MKSLFREVSPGSRVVSATIAPAAPAVNQPSVATKPPADIILKFFFPERSYKAASFEKMATLPTHIRDQMHAAKLEEGDERASLGRHRHNRVDTGDPLFGRHGLNEASVSMIRRSLQGGGYVIVDMHRFEQDNPRYGKQMVVCVTFRHKSLGETEVTPDQDQAVQLQFLSEQCWGQVHVWDNTLTPANNFTVNCTVNMLDHPAKWKLAFRGGKMVQIPANEED